MAQALIFLAPGYEEVEMLTVVDLLRRADIEIDMVSITDSLEVTSTHNITIKADTLLKDADFDAASMIILPGGIPGTPNLLACKPLSDKIEEFADRKKWLSAICAAPTIYDKLGLYEGAKATCYPDFADKLTDAVYVKQPVVVDGIFTTSRGAGTTIEFAAAIIERFTDKETADSILEKIIYNDTYE